MSNNSPPCDFLENYRKLNKISEGSFGVVSRIEKDGEIFALKEFKKSSKSLFGFPTNLLREIEILSFLNHKNILKLFQVVFTEDENLSLLTEYCEVELKTLLESSKFFGFKLAEIKNISKQILTGVFELHKHEWCHRDIKTSNILLNLKGTVKLCDFGLARPIRSFCSSDFSSNDFLEICGNFTQNVVTLWYRAPELILAKGALYDPLKVDVWSVGCCLGELFRRSPLFKGKSEQKTLEAMIELLGTPNELNPLEGFNDLCAVNNWSFLAKKQNPKWEQSSHGFPSMNSSLTPCTTGFRDLLKSLLKWKASNRAAIQEVLNSKVFSEEPLPCRDSDFTWLQEMNNEERSRNDYVNNSQQVLEANERGWHNTVEKETYLEELESFRKKQKL